MMEMDIPIIPSSLKYHLTLIGGGPDRREEQVRTILEELSGEKFPKKRPDWLNGMELDGYCHRLGIAFEYDGEQYYQKENSNPGRAYHLLKIGDRWKDYACAANHIPLIRVSYRVDNNNLRKCVMEKYNEALSMKKWTNAEWDKYLNDVGNEFIHAIELSNRADGE